MILTEKTLVTGGSGLVGTSVLGGKKPTSTEMNLLDFDSTIQYLHDNKIESVIHCAAKVGGVKDNSTYPCDYFTQNMQMSLNLFEACRVLNVKKIVSVLSTCIFPANATYPLTIDQIQDGEPHESNYGYAYAKRMQEVLARSYRDQHGLNIVSLVPCNIYGPNDNFRLNESHVIPGLIHKFYLARESNTDMTVWGSGKATREFLYSEDFGKVLVWALNSYESDVPMIVSPDSEINIGELVEIIQNRMDFTGKIVYTNDLEGQLKKPSDNSEFKKTNPSFEFTEIEDGIDQTVTWFEENYSTCRR